MLSSIGYDFVWGSEGVPLGFIVCSSKVEGVGWHYEIWGEIGTYWMMGPFLVGTSDASLTKGD